MAEIFPVTDFTACCWVSPPCFPPCCWAAEPRFADTPRTSRLAREAQEIVFRIIDIGLCLLVNGGWGRKSCAGSLPAPKLSVAVCKKVPSASLPSTHSFLAPSFIRSRESRKNLERPIPLMSANFIHTTPSLFPQVNTLERRKLFVRDWPIPAVRWASCTTHPLECGFRKRAGFRLLLPHQNRRNPGTPHCQPSARKQNYPKSGQKRLRHGLLSEGLLVAMQTVWQLYSSEFNLF